jgi:hypothetical protein
LTVATQRLLGPSRVGDAHKADTLVRIVSILGARRRELRASAGERLRFLEARTSAAAPRHIELEERLVGLEGCLERLERARTAQSQRSERRRERIMRLREQLEILRGPSQQPSENARMYQLGSALMYIGGLAVLWVVLLELALAFGL